MVISRIPAASHLGGRGTGRTAIAPLPAAGAHTWLLCAGERKELTLNKRLRNVFIIAPSLRLTA